MKLLLIGLILGGAYAAGLMKSTDMVFGGVLGLHEQYQSTAATADQWALGNTSESFTLR